MLIAINVYAIQKVLKLLFFNIKEVFSFDEFKAFNPFSISYFFNNTTLSAPVKFAMDTFHVFHLVFILVLWLLLVKSSLIPINRIKLLTVLGITYGVVLTILSLLGVFIIVLSQ